MIRKDFADGALRLLQVEDPATVDAFIHDDLASAANQAYQTLWSSRESRFFTETQRTLSILPGVSAYTVPTAVQAVRQPVTLGTAPPLIEVDNPALFARPALLGLSLTISGTPKLYLVDSTNAGSTVADAVRLVLRLKPTPTLAGTLTYTAVDHPPRFTPCDLRSDVLHMPAPHEYAESILLPLTRYYLSRCHWFTNIKILGELKADYREAMRKLKLLPPDERRENPEPQPALPGDTPQPPQQ